MELKIFLSVAAGIAAFFIAYKTGSKLKAILIPAGVAGILTMLPVLADPKSLGFFGPIGLVVFVVLASVVPAISAAIGCGLGFVVHDLKSTNRVGDITQNSSVTFSAYASRFKEIYLTPKNTRAIIISAIGILLMYIAYIVMLTTHENISSDLKTPILLLNPIGLIMFLYGINKLFKK